LAQSEPQVD